MTDRDQKRRADRPVFPADWIDETSKRSGEVISIIGAEHLRAQQAARRRAGDRRPKAISSEET